MKDSFDMINLIEIMFEWYKENSYKSPQYDDDPETVYTHKLLAGGTFLDAWLWWRYIKFPLDSNKDTSYVRYHLNVEMHFLGDAQETEIMHKGRKMKLYKGEVEFYITPSVEMDFRDEWEKGGVLGLVHDVFRKKIFREELESHKNYIYSEAYKLQGLLKQFFKVESFVAEETVQQPSKGLPD